MRWAVKQGQSSRAVQEAWPGPPPTELTPREGLGPALPVAPSRPESKRVPGARDDAKGCGEYLPQCEWEQIRQLQGVGLLWVHHTDFLMR